MQRRCLALLAAIAAVSCGGERPTVIVPPISEAELRQEEESRRQWQALFDRQQAPEALERRKKRDELALARLTPVPAGARLSLLVDKEQFLLGENVLVHYCLENRGDQPFTIDMGSDYRGTSASA